MSKSIKKVQEKLEIRQRRTFSEELKRQKVKLLIEKKTSVAELSKLYGVARTTIYRWLYKYSPHHNKGTTQVVQMTSEVEKTKALQEQLAKTEQILGQKQIQLDFLEKIIELASKDLGVDIKKNFTTQLSNGIKTTKRK